MTGERPIRLARCPMCGKPAVPQARPFCSTRCANLDLKRWLSEGYVLPGTEPADPDDPDFGEPH